VLETLEQVRSQEPVPPSRLQPKVPRDLETICLKSLSKEKRKRYADCAAFAEDLHRFVAGEPILARPVGLPQRLWRWSRRNPRVAALIGLTAVFAVMAFATFVGSYFQIRREKAETEKYANAAEQAAELALGSLGDLVGKVQDRLKDPALRDVRQDILQLAQQRVKGVLESGTHLPGLERVAGLSHMQMAWIAEDLDQNDEAYKEWLEAYQILKKAAEDHPESTKAACNLGVALHHIGAAALTRGDAQQGREYLNEALAVLKDLDEHPRNGDLSSNVVKQNLAETYDMIGAIDPTPSAALQNYRLAIKLLGAIPETSSTKDNNDKTAALAKSNLLLAMGQMSLGQLDEAESNFVNASKLENHLLVTDPNNLERRLQMARIEENFGQLCLLSSQTKAMKDHFAKALSLYQHLLAADPKNTRHQNAVANAHYGLGAAELRLGEQHEAESNFAEALKIMEGRVKSDSKNNNLKKILMIYRARCGNIKDATATAEKVCKFMGNDKDSLYQAANSYALCAAAVGKGKTISKLTQAEHEERQRYTTSAIEALQKCIALGYDDFLGMKADPDFDPIRDDARFQKLLDELGKRTKKQ
jgi:tetratricopeptide (TPR) repeat protein